MEKGRVRRKKRFFKKMESFTPIFFIFFYFRMVANAGNIEY